MPAHFVTFPTNDGGVIIDSKMQDTVERLSGDNFGFKEFYVYSHGWWTNGNEADSQYNTFSSGFAERTNRAAAAAKSVPPNYLAAGIHWPSTLTEDSANILNFAQAVSFYTMEKRADGIGSNGVYALVRLLLKQLDGKKEAIRINLLGHSFGCKVVCSALQKIATDETVVIPKNVRIQLVLLQAAFEERELEPGYLYGNVIKGIPNIRLLITRSDEDLALKNAFPAAHGFVSYFDPSRVALGAGYATPATAALFKGSTANVDVGAGFTAGGVPKARLVVANLTSFHQTSGYQAGDPFSGHHSDIFAAEVYELLIGFLG